MGFSLSTFLGLVRVTSDGYFDDTKGRYIEFTVAIMARPVPANQFLDVLAAEAEIRPYMYFDTSRHPAYDMTATGVKCAQYDPPAASAPAKLGPGSGAILVHAFKKQNPSWSYDQPSLRRRRVTFVNPDKYQILHCGIDNTWDNDTYDSV